VTPSYQAMLPVWISQGGIVAIPNLRGGGEFGESWHHAGMLEKKQNVFDDFIAAAEWLITNRYTNSDHLAIEGASNGGLLVGAAMTQRPDLFRAVLCRFPLLDMLRYQNFSIAKTWVSEYGSPDDPKQFRTLLAYSPYQHVKSGVRYPAVLFVTGAGDTRVDPLHARKMTALMQARAANGPDRPILLRYDKIGGHSGPGGLTQQVDEGTDDLSFLDWQLGVNIHERNAASAAKGRNQTED
jgi:prolyl oligopeptidase